MKRELKRKSENSLTLLDLRILNVFATDFNFAETRNQLSKFWNKVFQKKMKTSSCSKSDNSQKMQNNICKRLQSSAQCVESTSHQLGNASSAKRFLVKIVFQSETIAKETTEVVQSSFT